MNGGGVNILLVFKAVKILHMDVCFLHASYKLNTKLCVVRMELAQYGKVDALLFVERTSVRYEQQQNPVAFNSAD